MAEEGQNTTVQVVALDDVRALVAEVANAASDSASGAAGSAADRVIRELGAQVSTLDTSTVALEATQYEWIRGSLSMLLALSIFTAALVGLLLGSRLAGAFTDGWR